MYYTWWFQNSTHFKKSVGQFGETSASRDKEKHIQTPHLEYDKISPPISKAQYVLSLVNLADDWDLIAMIWNSISACFFHLQVTLQALLIRSFGHSIRPLPNNFSMLPSTISLHCSCVSRTLALRKSCPFKCNSTAPTTYQQSKTLHPRTQHWTKPQLQLNPLYFCRKKRLGVTLDFCTSSMLQIFKHNSTANLKLIKSSSRHREQFPFQEVFSLEAPNKKTQVTKGQMRWSGLSISPANPSFWIYKEKKLNAARGSFRTWHGVDVTQKFCP